MLSLILTFLVGAGSVPDIDHHPLDDVQAKNRAVESFGLGTSLQLSLDYRVVQTPPDDVAHEFWLCLHWDFAAVERVVESFSITDAHMDTI